MVASECLLGSENTPQLLREFFKSFAQSALLLKIPIVCLLVPLVIQIEVEIILVVPCFEIVRGFEREMEIDILALFFGFRDLSWIQFKKLFNVDFLRHLFSRDLDDLTRVVVHFDLGLWLVILFRICF